MSWRGMEGRVSVWDGSESVFSSHHLDRCIVGKERKMMGYCLNAEEEDLVLMCARSTAISGGTPEGRGMPFPEYACHGGGEFTFYK